MRSSAALLLLALVAAPAFAADRAVTDAFQVAAPGKAWKRVAAMDAPGRLSWNTASKKETLGQLRVSLEGAPGPGANAALARLLELEKERVRDGERQSKTAERGSFVGDSTVVGGLKWVGFRVDVRSGNRTGTVTRWAALHPDYPRRQRAFLVALDEETPPGARPVPRGTDAMAVLRSLAPRGSGLGGGLATAWLDARAAAFAAHLDTTTKLCWRSRGADASAQRAWLGYGRGLALEGDFWQVSDLTPTDSVVDAASTEYGAAFDRNGDGKIDLVLLNRGIATARGSIVLPIAAVLADDDFDGQVDGCLVENGDADGDGQLDHRLLVVDTDRDGRPDRALRFVDAVDEKGAKSVSLRDGLVADRVVGCTANLIDFAPTWRDASARMAELSRSRSDCGR
jgi:hypothetical protein